MSDYIEDGLDFDPKETPWSAEQKKVKQAWIEASMEIIKEKEKKDGVSETESE